MATLYTTELRRDGRRLAGTVVTYGERSALVRAPNGEMVRERFAAGSMRWSDVALNVMHDRKRILTSTADTLRLTDTGSAVELVAELPSTREADDALELLDRGVLRGLSSEFFALAEDRADGGERLVTDAMLTGVGLVDRPAYPSSRAERRNTIGTLAAAIPIGADLACQCHRGEADTVQFAAGAFRDAIETAASGGRDILALASDTKTGALASLSRGTLRLTERDGGLAAEIDLPDTGPARDAREQVGAVNLLLRPLFDQDGSEFEESGGIARYRKVALRGILVGATSADAGWPAAVFTAARARRRAAWL